MRTAVSILISGKVQGVFFRASAKAKADALGIVGTVRNQPDRSVYIEAEGEESALEQFKSWCSMGPPLATVTTIEVTLTTVKHFSGFAILK